MLIDPTIEAAKDDHVINISEEELLASFKKKYVEKLSKDRNGFFGFYRRSNIHYQMISTLDQILSHALFEGGHRSLFVIKELRWIDDKNNLNLNIPALKAALERVQARQANAINGDPKEKTPLIA